MNRRGSRILYVFFNNFASNLIQSILDTRFQTPTTVNFIPGALQARSQCLKRTSSHIVRGLPPSSAHNPTKRSSGGRDFSRGFAGLLPRSFFNDRARGAQPGRTRRVSRNPIKEKPGRRRLCRLIDEQGVALLPAPPSLAAGAQCFLGGSANNGQAGEWIRTRRIPVMREPDQR